jgi:hypothetical protein
MQREKENRELESKSQQYQAKRLRKMEGKDGNSIRQLLRTLSLVPYEDTDHISVDQFEGQPQTLNHPVEVSRAAQLCSMLEFEIIDLIKRGYLRGVHYGEKWYFDLEQTKKA